MTEEQYYRIARACDRLLRHPDATLEWIATPWLHVLNEHPAHLAKYDALTANLDSRRKRATPLLAGLRLLRRGRTSAYTYASLTKNLLQAAAHRGRRKAVMDSEDRVKKASFASKIFDVVIVSHLVNIDHLEMEDDFYFGRLQTILADGGLSSLALLRNQTGHPTSGLLERARRNGPAGRSLLPDVASLSEEADFIRRCLKARDQLRRVERTAPSLFDRQVARTAGDRVVSGDVVASLRLHGQIESVCRQFRPSVVMTLYEGHAWERCVWHAAKTSLQNVLCVGYQHTTIWRHSYAVKRSLGGDGRYDPDLILTVGDFAGDILKRSRDLGNKCVLTLGTHRRKDEASPAAASTSAPTFLVLPEGLESECIHLFDFALACARRLPDVRFIFRTHPVLPFVKIQPRLRGYRGLPVNVEVSHNRAIEDDFARAGYVLYRGSSSVIYGILSGLKPYYVGRPCEMSIDPLDGLLAWREHVSSVEEFIDRYASHQTRRRGHWNDDGEWQVALEFCKRYVQPLRQEIIDRMMELAKKTSRIDGLGNG